MNSTTAKMAASLQDGHMSLETLWRLLEHQRKQNASMASVVGLDEAKILIQNDQRSKQGGMTTLGKNIYLKNHSKKSQKNIFIIDIVTNFAPKIAC